MRRKLQTGRYQIFNPISALARSSFITFLLLKNVFVIIIRKKVAVVFGLVLKESLCVEYLFYET